MSTEIKKYCNQHFYTDVHPWEVVEVINEKKVVIRPMKEIRKTDPIIIPGGFAGHCINNRAIEYDYESIPDAQTMTIKLHKKGWNFGQFRMSDEPLYYYDYNF
ncbi:MAG TPA: hypothetical protein PKC87_01385 [Candidatus Absconditabacterales bacterium]|nr:hypothetical protein [Candidatus Absconditabacterales bacterium]